MLPVIVVIVVDCQLWAEDLTSTALSELILSDMTQAHEARPQGVPDTYNWALKPRIGKGNHIPKDWSAVTMWGQIYPAAEGHLAQNVRVQIQDLRLYYLSKKDGAWHRLQGEGVEGAAYRQDFANDANTKADYKTSPDGSVSVKLTPGYNFHFWPKIPNRASLNSEDVAAIASSFQARLIVDDPNGQDDRDKARLLGSCGGDYWRSLQAGWKADWSNNADWALSRFRFITKEWKLFTACPAEAKTIQDNPPPLSLPENNRPK
jgi:hypothetical protein